MTSKFFRINTPQIVHHTIEQEIIIIDFETGSYFSLTGTGVTVWECLAQVASLDDIVDALMAQYAGDRAEIRRDAEQFLNELEREALIVPAATLPVRPSSSVVTIAAPKALLSFQPPTLAKYTDMQDLLLLDPIHGVDEQGWPVAKT